MSPLLALDPPIDMIITFILDIMHLLYLGIQLRLFQNWKDGEPAVRLSMAQRTELDRRTKMLKGDIPYEFKRKMRTTNHFPDFKAIDHRFFALYCGPIVFQKILSDSCYNHFLLFHVACRLISSREAVNHSRLAKQYFSDFVGISKTLYGLKFVSLNVHSSHHVVDDVVNSGSNADDNSTFPFESELYKAEYMLKSPNNTLAQYCRRIHEERSVLDLTARVPLETQILKTKNLPEAFEKLSQLENDENRWSPCDATPEEWEAKAVAALRQAQLMAKSNALPQKFQSSMPYVHHATHNPPIVLIRNYRTLNKITTGLKEVSSAVGSNLSNAKSWKMEPPVGHVTIPTDTSAASVSTVTRAKTSTNQPQPENTPILITVPHQNSLINPSTHDGQTLPVFVQEISEPPLKQMRLDDDPSSVASNQSSSYSIIASENSDDQGESSSNDDSDEDSDSAGFIASLQGDNSAFISRLLLSLTRSVH
ncbi:hypothetical protein QAD02_020751 [Eretmocerus hayati]|uniref:Uncharacterized protein n=1 Tax=Eretmocerus hayati TaxID=131215 RepID=A0ACC2PPJ8_9HYME|nr:hypothetical protein QAD02_020751 [Eretmocerus hayati]